MAAKAPPPVRYSQSDGLAGGHRLEERDMAMGWENPGLKMGRRDKI
jgi:hypothetical protein